MFIDLYLPLNVSKWVGKCVQYILTMEQKKRQSQKLPENPPEISVLFFESSQLVHNKFNDPAS